MTTPRVAPDEVFALLEKALPLRLFPTVRLPLAEALGRRIAIPVVSRIDIPAFTHSAMDGFAFAGALLENAAAPIELPVVGTAYAGHPFEGETPKDAALRIMTGAPVPKGYDTVIPFELAEESDGRVRFAPDAVRPGANVRLRGEEVKSGEPVLTFNARLTPEAIGLAASVGVPNVVCHRLPIAVFATGDELREPGEPLEPGQTYNANAHLLCALIRSWGYEVDNLGILPDDPDVLEKRLREAGREYNLLITSGGVGEGDKDLIGRVVRRLGKLTHVHLKQRPGKPFSFGRVEGAFFMALPGNPAACAVSARLYLKYVIDRFGDIPADPLVDDSALTTKPLKGRSGRTDWIRGKVTEENGIRRFTPSDFKNSSSLLGLADADALAMIPEGVDEIAEGECVLLRGL